jgi:hypothetical protein
VAQIVNILGHSHASFDLGWWVTMTELDRLLQQESNSRRHTSPHPLFNRRTLDQRNLVALAGSDFPATGLQFESFRKRCIELMKAFSLSSAVCVVALSGVGLVQAFLPGVRPRSYYEGQE